MSCLAGEILGSNGVASQRLPIFYLFWHTLHTGSIGTPWLIIPWLRRRLLWNWEGCLALVRFIQVILQGSPKCCMEPTRNSTLATSVNTNSTFPPGSQIPTSALFISCLSTFEQTVCLLWHGTTSKHLQHLESGLPYSAKSPLFILLGYNTNLFRFIQDLWFQWHSNLV